MRPLAYAFISFSLLACTGEPQTYEDCVLQNLKGVKESRSVSTIKSVCRSKDWNRSTSEPKSILLPSEVTQQLKSAVRLNEEVSLLTGAPDKYLTGYIYNGSRDWVISKVVIAFAYKGNEHSRLYETSVNIQPFSRGYFTVLVDDFYKGSVQPVVLWEIYEAFGYRRQ